MKRLAALAVAVAGVVLASSAAAAPARGGGSVVVTGRAGTMASVTLSSPLVFEDNSRDASSVADRGGWSALAVIAVNGKPVDRPLLVATSLDESFRCPASHCPYTAAGPPLFGSDVRGIVRLPAGRYQVILFGERDARVTARLAPRGLTSNRTYIASARPLRYLAETTEGVGSTGHDTQLHAYSQMEPGGSFGLMAMYDSMALDPAGVMSSTGCVTAGSNNTITRSVGGVAPCADHEGFDFVFGPYAGPVVDKVYYAPVQVSSIGTWGRSDVDNFGVGYDQTAVAASSYLRSLAIGFELA